MVAAVVGVLALRSNSGERSVAPTGSASNPGIEHVHGLGVNPADGAVIVATHFGSFRLPDDGDTERIGSSYQDTMGFTVLGPDHFLGSGHPDVAGMRAGQPGRLGLIESTDGGETWSAVSLSGDVDFHGLAVASDGIYGWDAGTAKLMFSADRKAWEERSVVEIIGFAVDPANDDRVVAGTGDATLFSTDGGRSWERQSSPALALLSWNRKRGLWGVAADGPVWHYDGTAWQEVGSAPGEPHALLASDDELIIAVTDDDVTSIFSSADGSDWDLRHRDD